jgi:hypothetical protein
VSIKYYRLAKDEELPDEFCAVRDVGGDPSEYTFYVPEGEIAKLRELVRDTYYAITTLEEANDEAVVRGGVMLDAAHFAKRMRELGIEEV